MSLQNAKHLHPRPHRLGQTPLNPGKAEGADRGERATHAAAVPRRGDLRTAVAAWEGEALAPAPPASREGEKRADIFRWRPEGEAAMIWGSKAAAGLGARVLLIDAI